MLVDDHALFRAGVRSELDGLVDVVGDAATVAEAVALIRDAAPDVVLLDVHMPDGGGLEVLRQIGGDLPATQFLALSVSDAAEDVIAVIRAGARGYVTKTISGADLADAVRRVHEGDAVFSPRLAGFVLDAFAGAAPAAATAAADEADLDQLTPREREVLQHIARGYMYKEIAQRLGIRPRRSKRTCRRCCASCSCPAATSCRAGRRRGGWWIRRSRRRGARVAWRLWRAVRCVAWVGAPRETASMKEWGTSARGGYGPERGAGVGAVGLGWRSCREKCSIRTSFDTTVRRAAGLGPGRVVHVVAA